MIVLITFFLFDVDTKVCTFLDLYLAKKHRNEENIIVFMIVLITFFLFDVDTNKQESKVTLRQILRDSQLLTLRLNIHFDFTIYNYNK